MGLLQRLRSRTQTVQQKPTQDFQLRSSPALFTPKNNRFIMERVPLRWISEGRITEADLALAATTPVLGQYAPTFGWPEDWGWYWEYLDAYIFVPEAAFAVKLKNRLIWKPGFEFETSQESVSEKLRREWKRRKCYQSLFNATKNALIWGNSYIESVDDSDAVWQEGSPADVAMGASMTNITGAPRPLKSFTPATKFYGLKNTDPRTVRIQIHPQRWDKEKATVKIEKFIQRRWAGPLAPTTIMGSDTELDFHPEQMLPLQFNKITGGIYGYSTYRETLFALKGYILMLQFLPSIVEKRADNPLHWQFGGPKFSETGAQVTVIPGKDEILASKTEIENKLSGEDFYTDILAHAEELYKTGGGAERIQDYVQMYKERVLVGLGIPTAVVTMAGGAEIKWGTFQFEMLEDETREYQQGVEDLANDYVTPRLLLNLGHKLGDGPEVEFHFNPITPEDWRANVEPLRNLFHDKVVSKEYVLDRLNIGQEAGQGTMYEPQQREPFPPGKLPEKFRVTTAGGRTLSIERMTQEN